MKYWEIIANKIAASGWTWGYSSTMTPRGGVISLTPAAETDEGLLSDLTSF